MKLLIMLLFLPLTLTATIIGAVSAVIHVGLVNGYTLALEAMEKVSL